MSVQCEMSNDCPAEVTHVEDKGYIYCTEHANDRRSWNPRVRKMRAWERRWIAAGKVLPTYRPGPEPKGDDR